MNTSLHPEEKVVEWLGDQGEGIPIPQVVRLTIEKVAVLLVFTAAGYFAGQR